MIFFMLPNNIEWIEICNCPRENINFGEPELVPVLVKILWLEEVYHDALSYVPTLLVHKQSRQAALMPNKSTI